MTDDTFFLRLAMTWEYPVQTPPPSPPAILKARPHHAKRPFLPTRKRLAALMNGDVRRNERVAIDHAKFVATAAIHTAKR